MTYNSAGFRYVPGEGSRSARVMLIGEGPGREEDQQGRPFVGAAGQVLWQLLLRYCNLTRGEVYVTNLVKYRTGMENEDPSPEQLAAGAEELQRELFEVQPEIVVTLGAFSTRAFLGDGVEMQTVHGMPQRDSRSGSLYPGPAIFPCYHPAAGLHSVDLLSYTAWDLEQLGRYLEKPWTPPIPIPASLVGGGPNYAQRAPPGGSMDGWFYPELALDTEYNPETGEPICVSWCGLPEQAGVVMAGDFGGIARVQRIVDLCDVLYLHNSLADLPVLRRLGLRIPTEKMVDTMVLAYLLQIEPQGLKSLALRHLGMKMRDYEDVLAPYREKAYREHFYSAAQELVMDTLGHRPRRVSKKSGKELKGYEKCKCGDCVALAKIERALSESAAGRVTVNWVDRWASLDRDPPLPSPSLLMVPESEWIPYACADADATLRLGPVLLAKCRAMGLV